jgi:hypothetical protein
VSGDSEDEDVEYMGHFCSECSIPPPGGVRGWFRGYGAVGLWEAGGKQGRAQRYTLRWSRKNDESNEPFIYLDQLGEALNLLKDKLKSDKEAAPTLFSIIQSRGSECHMRILRTQEKAAAKACADGVKSTRKIKMLKVNASKKLLSQQLPRAKSEKRMKTKSEQIETESERTKAESEQIRAI